MIRRLVTIHKALKGAQAARVLALLADEIGEDDVLVEASNEGIVVKANDWNRKVHAR